MILIIDAVIIVAKPTPSTSGFDLSPLLPLLGVLIGGLVSAATSFFLNGRSNKQQEKRDLRAYEQQRMRDLEAYRQQIERDRIAYEQQKEREQAAYKRSLKDAKRERLHSSYKVLLNAAEEYESVMHQLQIVMAGETEQTRNQRLEGLLKKAVSGMDEALVEITLEDVGDDVKLIFGDLRQAFQRYLYALNDNRNNPHPMKSFTYEEITRDREQVVESSKRLKEFMRQHLTELEH